MTHSKIQQIEAGMDGVLRPAEAPLQSALLKSPCVQNHAAFLSCGPDGLQCLWFGGSLEGRSDIGIWRSTFQDGTWRAAECLSDDPDHSEQNPVQFHAPDGRTLLFNTAQVGGNQDDCALRMRSVGQPPRRLDLPAGTFVRGPVHVRADGAWLLPLFRCVGKAGIRWTGSDDTAALAISADNGTTWRMVEVPGSRGCVHMTLVSLGGARFAAFFRRRQADFVFRTSSEDGGETWRPPQATNVPNNNSSISVIRLADGRIAMACNPSNAEMHPQARRASLYDELGEDDGKQEAPGSAAIWGVPRAPMAICLSGDDGQSFDPPRVVEDGPGTCMTNNSTDGKNAEMSYPSLLQAPDGSLDLAYTYHRRAIKHVRLSQDWLQGA